MTTQGSVAGHQVFPDEEDEEAEYESEWQEEEEEEEEEYESEELTARGKRQKSADLWEGFSILLKQDVDSGNFAKCAACKKTLANSGERCTSPLGPYSYANPDIDGARRALAMCIITTGQSLSLVESDAFQRFSRALNPRIPVSRSVLDRDVMNLYGKEKDTLRCIISEASGGLSFSVDKWKSKETGECYNDDIYICITACFIDADWKLQRRIVGFKLLECPDDTTYVADTVAFCFSEWKVHKKVMSITLDNVLYDVSMADSLKTTLHDKAKLLCNGELYQVHCCTDIMNSVVKAGLEHIADIIGKIRHGIRYINYSAITKDAFYQYAKDICHLDVTMKLRADLVVTWDSTYKMMGCALYYKDALNHFTSTDETFLSEFHLCDEEWEKVAAMEKFIKPIYDITCTFLRAKYKTANLYFLGVYKVYRLLEVTKVHDNFMSSMVKDVKEKFDKYWSDYSMTLACAAVFDPRYKLRLISYCFGMIYGDAEASKRVESVVALLRRFLTEYENSSGSSPVGTNVIDYHAKDDLFDGYAAPEQMSALDWYLESPTVDLNTDLDVLEFWRGMSKCYPGLASLARDILAIPITTVATKSVFNVGEKVLNRRRGKLSPDLLEMLISLHDWTCPKDRNGIAVSAVEEYYSDDDYDYEEDLADLFSKSEEESDDENGSTDNDGDD
ncbi:hypothetical protein ACP4OV_009086 [Aristida adscensionis]